MVGPDQKIKTVLIPEVGLNLAPEFVQDVKVSSDFSRVFAHLVGKGNSSGVLLRATSSGSLHVVSSGVPFEAYLVYNGTGEDAFTVDNTEEFATAYAVTDFLIETHPGIISFRSFASVWLPEKVLPVGYHSIDFIHYGFKIRNRTPGSNTIFEITVYQ
ncbi:hypothetical protein ES705_49496 [subsurface metagenome]